MVIGMAVLLAGCVEEKNITAVPTPAITATVSATPSVIIPEVAPTGKGSQVKLDSRRGFIPDIQTIEAGDEVVWDNFDKVTVTLVSNDGLFDAKSLAYYQQHRYVFNKPGSYTFSLENRNLNGTIIVVSRGSLTPAPSVKASKEPLSTALLVTARMKTLANWSYGNEKKYELNWLTVSVLNQQNDPLSIQAQIISGDQILEEKSFVLDYQGSVEYSNEKNHFVNSTNVTLRLLVKDYPPIEYPFVAVDELN